MSFFQRRADEALQRENEELAGLRDGLLAERAELVQLVAHKDREIAKRNKRISALERHRDELKDIGIEQAATIAEQQALIEDLQAQLAGRALRDVSVAEARLIGAIEHEKTVAEVRPALADEAAAGNASYPKWRSQQ